jgi:uncharacterized protein
LTEATDTPISLARWELRPRDGGPVIRGDLRFLAESEPRTAVLICHGFKGFKDWGFFPTLGREIAARGHAAISFNFSGSGIGADGEDFSALEMFADNTHSRNVREIGHVLQLIRSTRLFRRPPRAIGLIGHSRGGGEAVLAAEANRVDALVTWSAIATVDRWPSADVEAWTRGETVRIRNARTGQEMPIHPTFWKDIEANRDRLDILAAARRAEVPWLIVHGEADESVGVEDARLLYDATTGSAELLLVPDASHTFGATHPLEAVPAELRVALDATLRWFDRHLAIGPDGPAADEVPDR